MEATPTPDEERASAASGRVGRDHLREGAERVPRSQPRPLLMLTWAPARPDTVSAMSSDPGGATEFLDLTDPMVQLTFRSIVDGATQGAAYQQQVDVVRMRYSLDALLSRWPPQRFPQLAAEMLPSALMGQLKGTPGSGPLLAVGESKVARDALDELLPRALAGLERSGAEWERFVVEFEDRLAAASVENLEPFRAWFVALPPASRQAAIDQVAKTAVWHGRDPVQIFEVGEQGVITAIRGRLADEDPNWGPGDVEPASVSGEFSRRREEIAPADLPEIVGGLEALLSAADLALEDPSMRPEQAEQIELWRDTLRRHLYSANPHPLTLEIASGQLMGLIGPAPDEMRELKDTLTDAVGRILATVILTDLDDLLHEVPQLGEADPVVGAEAANRIEELTENLDETLNEAIAVLEPATPETEFPPVSVSVPQPPAEVPKAKMSTGAKLVKVMKLVPKIGTGLGGVSAGIKALPTIVNALQAVLRWFERWL